MKNLFFVVGFIFFGFSCQSNLKDNSMIAHTGNNEIEATCTGSSSCNACKNCKYCKYCSKNGGSCGVCK